MNIYQKTLAKPVVVVGKGLHSGRIVRMELLPAEAESGITFERTDTGAPPLRASIAHVSSTELSTTLGSGLQSVSTIEHVMAALFGAGIDNVRIRLNGPEVPIMDGSAEPFLRSFQEAGYQILKRSRHCFVVERPFECKLGDSVMRITPADELSVRCSISFGHRVIGYQSMDFAGNAGSFADVATARTFCHIDDVQEMRRRGLALGGSLQNAIVVTNEGIANEEGLRGDNEFVRHKLLDLLGDIYLLEGFLLGAISVYKPGHRLHAEFLRRLILVPGVLKRVGPEQLSTAPKAGSSSRHKLPPIPSFA